jgi:hypothetical protein
MSREKAGEKFRKTQRTLAVLLLLMTIASLYLPYIVLHIPGATPINGTQLSSVWLPLFFVSLSCICLMIGNRRSSAVAACCSAVSACISLYFVYREIKLLDIIFAPAIHPGMIYRSVASPGIGFTLVAGGTVVLLFVSLLAIRYSPPPRRLPDENDLIDDMKEND